MNHKVRFAIVSLALALFLPAQAATLDEVIAKSIEAHGGTANWEKIQSMKVTGELTAFSEVSPFTMHRKGAMYHIDQMMGKKKVVIGYDGENYWWDNHWFQEGAQAVTGEEDLKVLEREAELTPAYFDYKSKGHKLKLIEDADLEGMQALGIELTRADETVETWYLDPKTYLPMGKDSPGSDFGQAMPRRTFYDDYRDVAGVKMPYFIESQWYTRDHIMVIDKIEANVEIDDALFAMPVPMGMGPLLSMVGSWKVALQTRQQPGAPWVDAERTSEIESALGGAMLRETFKGPSGASYERTMSYDRFRKFYRVTQIDDTRTYLDIQQGDFNDDGRLIVSNMESKTTLQMFGMSIFTRMNFFDITPDGFSTEVEASIDGGENWFVAAKSQYTRQAEE